MSLKNYNTKINTILSASVCFQYVYIKKKHGIQKKKKRSEEKLILDVSDL
jgi:hypothetical protein